MKAENRLVAFGLAVAALLAGGGGRQEALAVTGVIQNPSNGHWYKYVPANGVLWDFCKTSAEGMGGYLATITSASEQTWVYTNLGVSTQGNCWIGGTDFGTEGTWRWVNGETWGYANWASGEPNNCCGGEQWLEMFPDGTWNDEYAKPLNGYIVEWDTDPNAGPPKAPPASPSDLVASVSYGSPILLRWKDNSDTEESVEIERRTADSSFAIVAELGPNTTMFEDPLLAPSTTYTYRVRATNSGGASDYSNEASETSSGLIPAPRPPLDLKALPLSPTSVRLTWFDNSVDEISFEVHRMSPGGEFEFVASTTANSWTYTGTGLAPDTDYHYGVRSVSPFRASFFAQASVRTLPTLSVTALRADLKDSPKFGKDSLKVQALFDFLPASPDGLFDPLAEGITLRAGDDAHPVVMTLPGGLDTWKVKGTKATWKSARGSTPKYMVQVDLEDRLVKASATGLELAAPPANPMRVSVGIGNDAGTARGDWEAKKPGYFRLR